MQDRLYEYFYGDYHSPENWELDTLIAHLEDRIKHYEKQEKYAYKNWLRKSMTASEMQSYYHKKKVEYKEYLSSVLKRKELENNKQLEEEK